MCGIVGYIGSKNANPILISGLKRLEYRGYDSAGIAIIEDKNVNIFKQKGRLEELEKVIKPQQVKSHIGIGHTRWATHGEPNTINAHPHQSQHGDIVIVHNGIIENYQVLKIELEEKGYTFQSDTDTEVFANLIEYIYLETKCNVAEAIRLATQEVVGAFAIAVISPHEADKIIIARQSSPLVIGIGKNEMFIASDASAMIDYVQDVIYLEDKEMGIISATDYQIKTFYNQNSKPIIQTLDMEIESLEKGGFDFFMHKEIHEQIQTIEDSFRGRIDLERNKVTLGGIRDYLPHLCNAQRIIFVSCGTSWHAALVAKYLIEDMAGIPVQVEYASEFRYRNPVVHENDFVIGISQSGETADTLAALQLARKKGATILSICNVVGSSIARYVDAGIYTHAGTEIGVASTKAFTAQITVLILLAIHLAQERNRIALDTLHTVLTHMKLIPRKVKQILDRENMIAKIAAAFQNVDHFLYLGRGYNFPIALEGALKLKEISYIHAEGYPAAEMKHGPIALIDEKMPVVVIATNDSTYEKVHSNIQEIKSRRGKVIAIVHENDNDIAQIADHTIFIPQTPEILSPILSTIPLQLLAYHIAVNKNCDVDKPRNLAKSVTVE